MTSPLFLGHLAGVPLEIMNPATDRDTTYTKIFVGGLPYHTDDASLGKYFESFGDIDEAVVIIDKQTGKSRGYGFVTMVERAAAEQACKDANPIIDGRRANVNLAYLGAKPRSSQTALSLGVQQVQPLWAQRQYGLIQHYVLPQTYLQPNLVLQSQLGPAVAALASPYLDYSSAYSPYTPPGLEQCPCTPSPSPSAGYLPYHSYCPGTAAPPMTTSPTTPVDLNPPHARLTTASVAPHTVIQYQPPNRMQ